MTQPYVKRPGSQFIGGDYTVEVFSKPRPYTWLRRLSGKVDHTSMMLRYAYYMAQQETSELKEQFKSALAMGNMLQRGWPMLRAHWLREEWRLRNGG